MRAATTVAWGVVAWLHGCMGMGPGAWAGGESGWGYPRSEAGPPLPNGGYALELDEPVVPVVGRPGTDLGLLIALHQVKPTILGSEAVLDSHGSLDDAGLEMYPGIKSKLRSLQHTEE